MKNELEIEHLITSELKKRYGIEIATIIPLALGANAYALIYKVQSSNQKTYFVKLKRGKHNSSASLQFLLHNASIKEIICPIKTVNDQPQIYVQDFNLTVYPFIDGSNIKRNTD